MVTKSGRLQVFAGIDTDLDQPTEIASHTARIKKTGWGCVC
jgi:hypothetical protein